MITRADFYKLHSHCPTCGNDKVGSTLKEQIKSVTSANSENLQSLQSLPIKTGNFINLRDKEF